MFHFVWGHLCLWNDVVNWTILSVRTWHIVQDQVVEVTVWTWEVFWEPVEVWHALPVDAVGEVEVGQMGQGPKHQLKIVGPTHHHVPHAQPLQNNRSGHYLNYIPLFQSRIILKKRFSYKQGSRFASVVLYGVFGPLRLLWHNCWCHIISLAPEATHKARLRVIEGHHVSSKSHSSFQEHEKFSCLKLQ